MRMLSARAVSAGGHDSRMADVFPGAHSGTERMPNFLDDPALAVVNGAVGDLRRGIDVQALAGETVGKRSGCYARTERGRCLWSAVLLSTTGSDSASGDVHAAASWPLLALGTAPWLPYLLCCPR